jgi:hypothetical protein
MMPDLPNMGMERDVEQFKVGWWFCCDLASCLLVITAVLQRACRWLLSLLRCCFGLQCVSANTKSCRGISACGGVPSFLARLLLGCLLFSLALSSLPMHQEYFSNPQFRTDGLKIYPTLVIRGTGPRPSAFDLWCFRCVLLRLRQSAFASSDCVRVSGQCAIV